MSSVNKPVLGLLDIVGLVVGAIVGADIYVASAFGSEALGPAALISWLIAGLMAVSIAYTFAQCAMLVPRVGGPYAYVSEAFGPLWGFIVGWSLWFAEWISISVFPIALVRYLGVFFPNLSLGLTVLLKAGFVAFITFNNYLGVKKAGRLNDILTIAKLIPLILFTLLGLLFFIRFPGATLTNFTPFLPRGWGGLSGSLVLIFWAYAGFELATIPSSEVKDARQTIPRALLLGMGVVIAFYLLTNIVLMGAVNWSEVALSTAPLTLGFERIAGAIFPSWGKAAAVFITLGAVVSITGSDESGTIGTSRLAYAMAADGYLPSFFSRLHPKYNSPYISLIFQGVTAFAASLLGTLGGLIKVSVFFLAVAYIFTTLASFKLSGRQESKTFHLPGNYLVFCLSLFSSVFLLTQVGYKTGLFGLVMLLVGLPVYSFFSPKSELKDIKTRLESLDFQVRRIELTGQHFLARAAVLMIRFLSKPRFNRLR